MSMFKSLHKYYADCFTNGEFDSNKVLENKLISDTYDTEFRLNLLEKVYSIILNAKFMNEMTIYYITKSNRTYDDTVKMYNEEHPDNMINISTGKSRIIYCQRKVSEVFGDIKYESETLDFIQWLFYDKAHIGLELSDKKIELRNEFLAQFNKFNDIYGEQLEVNRKDMLIKIPTYEKVNELSQEEFDNFMEIIRPYSKHVLSTIQNVVNGMEKEVGYFRFLMSKRSKLSEEDKIRKKELCIWLGKDIIFDENYYENNNLESTEENNDISVDNENEQSFVDNTNENSNDIKSIFNINDN